MLYFKDLNAFKKRVEKTTAWDDYFMLDGKMWNIYEYGGGSMFHMDYDYVYFLNKRTSDMIYVKYNLPSIQYVDGQKVEKGAYRLISVELLKNNPQWR